MSDYIPSAFSQGQTIAIKYSSNQSWNVQLNNPQLAIVLTYHELLGKTVISKSNTQDTLGSFNVGKEDSELTNISCINRFIYHQRKQKVCRSERDMAKLRCPSVGYVSAFAKDVFAPSLELLQGFQHVVLIETSL